jgi:hypothetical protein
MGAKSTGFNIEPSSFQGAANPHDSYLINFAAISLPPNGEIGLLASSPNFAGLFAAQP